MASGRIERARLNVPASGAGFVMRFQVRRDFLDRYDVQTAGGRTYQEYWMPVGEP
jgi:hypothetical protein